MHETGELITAYEAVERIMDGVEIATSQAKKVIKQELGKANFEKLATPVSVENGGTGATTALAARTNLGAFASTGGTISGSVTMTGNLTMKGTGTNASGAQINLGDSDYVHFSNPSSGNLEIKASKLYFNTAIGSIYIGNTSSSTAIATAIRDAIGPFKGATATTAGTTGLVPAPTSLT